MLRAPDAKCRTRRPHPFFSSLLGARSPAKHVQSRSLRHGRGPVSEASGPDLPHARGPGRRHRLDHPRHHARPDRPRLRPAPDRGRGLAPRLGELSRNREFGRVARLRRLHDGRRRQGDRDAQRPLLRRDGDRDAARQRHRAVPGQGVDGPRGHGELRRRCARTCGSCAAGSSTRTTCSSALGSASINRDLYQQLFANDDSPDKTIRTLGTTFQVIGEFEEPVDTLGRGDVVPETILVPITVAWYFTPTRQVKTLFAEARDFSELPAAVRAVEEILQRAAPRRAPSTRSRA